MSSKGYVFDTSEVTKGITTLCVQKVIKVNTGKYFFVEFSYEIRSKVERETNQADIAHTGCGELRQERSLILIG